LQICANKRAKDDEVALDKHVLTSCQRSELQNNGHKSPRSLDRQPDDKVFQRLSRRNQGRRPLSAAPGEGMLWAQEHCSRRATPLRAGDVPPLHGLTAGRAEHDDAEG
jgi:hypothetical protein